MQRQAILHIPLSQYAHGLDETHIVFRIRTAKNDIQSCELHYADRACRVNPVIFTAVNMEKTASDELFDYFETVLESPYARVCYYFALSDGSERVLYYSDKFTNELTPERSEYFQLPFNHRADIAKTPSWLSSAVVYNIFPDSFATAHRYISCKPSKKVYMGETVQGSNGGTIKGVTENIDYIKNLGINCVYLNPIFTAGQYHKYDLLDYFSIDPCFGTNEDFKKMVDTCHSNGIRVIIDGVFNHCGWNFFAFKDVIKNGKSSRYKDWFYNLKFPVQIPDSAEDIPTYDCFAYERMMPKMNTENSEVKEYFCKVCRYWIEQYGIDGWRLDVANEINTDFWREFRKAAKSANPECVLIGEVWESAQYWLHGDMFDSAMNYYLRNSCRDFFAAGKISAAEFDAHVTAMRMRYNKQVTYYQLNLLDSHDVPRFLSLCNGDIRKYKLAVLFQMFFIGVPSVFYGDEQGFVGIKESEYRRPMQWCGGEMEEFYKQVISLRKGHAVCSVGEYKTLFAEEKSGVYVFCRYNEKSRIVVALNASNEKKDIKKYMQGKTILSEGYEDGILNAFGYCIVEE